MKRIEKINIYLIAALCIIMYALLCANPVHAANSGRAEIYFDGWVGYEVENNRGEVIKYDTGPENDGLSYPFAGNMTVYEKEEVEETGWWATVDDSERFIIRSKKNVQDKYSIHMLIIKADSTYFALIVENVETIEVKRNDVTVNPVQGRVCEFLISDYIPSHHKEYSVEGKSSEPFTLKREGNGMVLSKADGKVEFSIYDKKQKKWAEGSYYCYNEDVKFSSKGTKLNISTDVEISQKKKTGIKNVTLLATNKGNNLFLQWDKMKKANNYVVLRYNESTGQYEQEAATKNNYYDIPNAEKNRLYKYKVVAKRGDKVLKTSYAVWALPEGSNYANATKVEVKKKTLKGRVGKKIKPKAKVRIKGTQPKFSNNIRWYSSNKKIAEVNQKTGKIKLKKRGKCKIWAKAHNGINSKKITVVVSGS